MSEIKVEQASSERIIEPARVSGRGRGRPLAAVAQMVEQNDPGLAAELRLSSAAMRAGDLIRRMRKEAGLSQLQLAEKLDVSQARISEIESGIGSQGPTWDLMERISNACGRVLIALPGDAFAQEASESVSVFMASS